MAARSTVWLALVALAAGRAHAQQPAPLPRVLDPRLNVELFAQEPQIVTPVGIAVDSRGRVLVAESHTHFRPANYQGPKADRIRRFEDTDGDGRADKIETVFEGTTATMGLTLEPSGSLLVVSRNELFRLADVDGDAKEHPKTTLVRLVTKESYPHNGLDGVALDGLGNLYLSMGENLGAPYQVIGSDGRALAGQGDGGGVFRLRADGSGIERFASGFWNPFHVTFDAFGRLFAVDNDPDSRPPCRLLHLVERGDYGYRMRNGRRGLHPYTSWFGQSPGTLGLVAGTGEAPSGIVAYESDNLPAEYRGDLLVTSWGDHQIERYRLQPRGATFQSVAQPVVVGNEHFRPVGIAVAPDGSIYFTDWVDVSYTLHGKGRIWHLKAPKPDAPVRPKDAMAALAAPDRRLRESAARKLIGQGSTGIGVLKEQAHHNKDPRARAAALVSLASAGKLDRDVIAAAVHDSDSRVQVLAISVSPRDAIDPAALATAASPGEVRAAAIRRLDRAADQAAAVRWLSDDDPWIRQAARAALARSPDIDQLLKAELPREATPRLEIALLLRESCDPRAAGILPRLLDDPDRRARALAVQWVGEARLPQFREQVLTLLKSNAQDHGLLELSLATLDLLERGGQPSAYEGNEGQAASRLIARADLPPSVVARLLRYLPRSDPWLTAERLEKLLADPDLSVRTETIRTLRERNLSGRNVILSRLATDEKLPALLRADAVGGLSAGDDAGRRLLLTLAQTQQAEVRHEALRSLRGAALTAEEKQSLKLLGDKDPASRDLVARLVEPAWKPRDRPDPQQPKQWVARFTDGDAAAGERVFFQSQGARCAACHRVGGHGGQVGPDLSAVGELGARRIMESILAPSREIAPQFVHWSLELRDGRTLDGQLVTEKGDGNRIYADSTGTLHPIHRDQIEEARALTTSVMPDGLTDLMTDTELRDLLAFLLTCR